jgi:hypothetical protein
MTQPLDVSAALLFRNGQLLIAQRPPGGHLAGLWEFPGGKREPGETWEDCLRRELVEPHLGRVPMSGLWKTARYLVFTGGNGADGPEWRGRFLPESLFTVFPSRFAGAVRLSPHFQGFSSAREAPS